MKEFITPVSIKVNGKEEVRKTLEKLDKMGFVWNSGRNLTTEKLKHIYREIEYIDVNNDGRVTRSYSRNLYDHVITAKEFLREGKECIVIYRKGDETIALDKTTGKKAVAKCHPDDEYDFNTGAKLAFARLTGEQPAAVFPEYVNCRCSTVREVKRAAKVGEYIKIINAYSSSYKKGSILKVTKVAKGELDRTKEKVKAIDVKTNKKIGCYILLEEYVVLENYQPEEKPQFKPYLTYKGDTYGCIGENTPIKDAIGRELKVGDTVELYNNKKELIGERPISFTGIKYFVMGIAGACNIDGTIAEGWKIIKKRDYKDIKNGETVDGIVYVLEG